MEIENQANCACCKYSIENTTVFCGHCGYPLQGTKQQQDEYIYNRLNKEFDLEELNTKVKKASNSLYWIAGLLTISTLISSFMLESEDLVPVLITSVILIAAFLAFAVWSKTKPAAALISGLSLYIIVLILNAIADPSTIVAGIGVLAVSGVEKIKKELNIK